MNRILVAPLLIVLFLACQQRNTQKKVVEEVAFKGSSSFEVPEKLSEWELFQEPLRQLNPNVGIMPYTINTPLFSDYALKSRFIKVPQSKPATYDPEEVMGFPVGTLLVKNFYYLKDFRDADGERVNIETRILERKPETWEAWTYLWNEEQEEAFLKVAGATVPVSWMDKNGVLQAINYSVPNKIQCKGCHEKAGDLLPIGPTARQLNKPYPYADGTMNQLSKWESRGLLAGIPPMEEWPIIPVWDDPKTGPLDQRARAWLEINCAHCHRREGPAKNTGLYLMYNENDPYRLGINKPPVAAGRGSGGMKYSVVPGKPTESLLLHRISSLDPGVMMPEVGRKMVHEEGVSLIREWISRMDTD